MPLKVASSLKKVSLNPSSIEVILNVWKIMSLKSPSKGNHKRARDFMCEQIRSLNDDQIVYLKRITESLGEWMERLKATRFYLGNVFSYDLQSTCTFTPNSCCWLFDKRSTFHTFFQQIHVWSNRGAVWLLPSNEWGQFFLCHYGNC